MWLFFACVCGASACSGAPSVCVPCTCTVRVRSLVHSFRTILFRVIFSAGFFLIVPSGFWPKYVITSCGNYEVPNSPLSLCGAVIRAFFPSFTDSKRTRAQNCMPLFATIFHVAQHFYLYCFWADNLHNTDLITDESSAAAAAASTACVMFCIIKRNKKYVC